MLYNYLVNCKILVFRGSYDPLFLFLFLLFLILSYNVPVFTTSDEVGCVRLPLLLRNPSAGPRVGLVPPRCVECNVIRCWGPLQNTYIISCIIVISISSFFLLNLKYVIQAVFHLDLRN